MASNRAKVDGDGGRPVAKKAHQYRGADGKTPQMRWEDRNPEWRAEYYRKNAKRIYSKHREWVAANSGKLRAYNRKRARDARLEFLEEYGCCCSCCGESHEELLTLDHSREWVARKTSGGRRITGKEEYIRLRKLGWPKNLGIRVLCMNCNWAERKGAGCPHSRERRNAG